MIETYIEFLQQRNYAISTIHGYTINAEKLLAWLEIQQINPTQASYQDIIAWVATFKDLQLDPKTINQYLRGARLFFDHLIELSLTKSNPAEEIRIKGHIRKMPHNLITEKELIQLHQDHPGIGLIGKRNKCMLGFIIYQGLGTTDLVALQVEHIKLGEGKVFIPEATKSNQRTLELKANQILELQYYIHQIRPQILIKTGKQSKQLFINKGRGNKLQNSISYLSKQAKQLNPKVTSIKQLRASVITSWLDKYPIRKVQHMAGHRYVSSTERYQTDQLKNLQEQVEKLHPLG